MLWDLREASKGARQTSRHAAPKRPFDAFDLGITAFYDRRNRILGRSMLENR